MLDRHPPAPRERASAVLERIAAAEDEGPLTLGAVLDAFGERGFALLLVLFSLPNLVPIPALGAVFGVPLLLLGGQMLLGRPHPWLPRRLLARTIERVSLRRLVGAVAPRLRRVEAVLRPRLTGAFAGAAERGAGLLVILLAVAVILPLPGSNFTAAIATILLALALLEEDGLCLFAGIAASVVAVAYTGTLFGGLAWGAGQGLRGWLGGP